MQKSRLSEAEKRQNEHTESRPQFLTESPYNLAPFRCKHYLQIKKSSLSEKALPFQKPSTPIDVKISPSKAMAECIFVQVLL